MPDFSETIRSGTEYGKSTSTVTDRHSVSKELLFALTK